MRITRGFVVVTLLVMVGFDDVVDARVVDVGAIEANDVLVVVKVGAVLAAVGRAVLHAAAKKAVAIVKDRSLVVLVTGDWTPPWPNSFQMKIRKGTIG